MAISNKLFYYVKWNSNKDCHLKRIKSKDYQWNKKKTEIMHFHCKKI